MVLIRMEMVTFRGVDGEYIIISTRVDLLILCQLNRKLPKTTVIRTCLAADWCVDAPLGYRKILRQSPLEVLDIV